MKKLFATILAFLLFLAQVPVIAEPSAINCKVAEINTYGHAVLDITDSFTHGQVYVALSRCRTLDGMVLARPLSSGSVITDASVNAYIDHKLMEAQQTTIAMKEKGGALDIQEVNNLVYSDERADFASDEVFANFRPVVEGKLYRSVSPVDNRIKRARTADNLIREAGVQTVMNMVNTDEEIVELMAADDYDSPYYRELYEAGKVIALEMSIDYTVKAFVEGLVEGFTFLSEGETPFLVHCLEGKDRTGFAIMTLEALMGWSEEQIVADYMKTYSNFYGIEPGTDRYDLIMEKNIEEMLRYMEALQTDTSTSETDLKTAAEAFLRENGMAEEALKRLEAKLASE